MVATTLTPTAQSKPKPSSWTVTIIGHNCISNRSCVHLYLLWLLVTEVNTEGTLAWRKSWLIKGQEADDSNNLHNSLLLRSRKKPPRMTKTLQFYWQVAKLAATFCLGWVRGVVTDRPAGGLVTHSWRTHAAVTSAHLFLCIIARPHTVLMLNISRVIKNDLNR